MANNSPQFSPTGGEGSTYGNFTFKNGGWQENAPIIPPKPKSQTNPGIFSTTNYRDELASVGNDINDFSNDPYMKMFNDLKLKNQQFEETARLNAEAEANREKVQQEQRSNARTAGVESANIAGGLSRYAPELANSAVQQAYNENYQKVQDIQAAEDLAIAKAKQARAANDLDVAKEQLNYVQELRKAKADAIQEANRLAFEKEKFQANYNLDVRRENRLSAEDKAKNSFDFGQEVADLEESDPGLMAYIRFYLDNPDKISSIPAESRDQVLAYADKVSDYDTGIQVNKAIDDIEAGGSKATTKSVLNYFSDLYKAAGTDFTKADKAALKTYIDSILNQ